MTMLERAARAVCEADGGAWDDESQDSRAFYDELALAVIRAIREPDKAMLSAMVQAAAEWNIDIVPEEAMAIWQAGIDKALEDRG